MDFKKEDGPFVKALDNALASFHVKRQAYYSGTFVGNHVHRALKVTLYFDHNISNMIIPSRRTTLQYFAILLYQLQKTTHHCVVKHELLARSINLFQKCHNIYDKNIVSDEEIEQLGKCKL